MRPTAVAASTDAAIPTRRGARLMRPPRRRSARGEWPRPRRSRPRRPPPAIPLGVVVASAVLASGASPASADDASSAGSVASLDGSAASSPTGASFTARRRGPPSPRFLGMVTCTCRSAESSIASHAARAPAPTSPNFTRSHSRRIPSTRARSFSARLPRPRWPAIVRWSARARRSRGWRRGTRGARRSRGRRTPRVAPRRAGRRGGRRAALLERELHAGRGGGGGGTGRGRRFQLR